MSATYQGAGYGKSGKEALDKFYETVMRRHGVDRNKVNIVAGREIPPEDTFDKNYGYRGVYSIRTGTNGSGGVGAQAGDSASRVVTRNAVREAPGASPSLVERVKKFDNPFK